MTRVLALLWIVSLGSISRTHGFVCRATVTTVIARDSIPITISTATSTSTRTTTRLWEESNRPSVRFSGTEALTSTTTNPIDAVLTVLASDVVSIALGLLGLVVIVAHRLSLLDDTSAESLTVQTRTDLLAVFACGSVLLNGITKLDVTAAMAESVTLEGISLPEPQAETFTLRWALESLVTATPAQSAVVLQRESSLSSSSRSTSLWKVVARAGIVPSTTPGIVPDATPILDRVASEGNTKETYLPTLQALPGKKEFPYLPANAQLALLVPMDSLRVLVLASNRSKSLSPKDVAWCRIVAERMAKDESNLSL